MAVAYAMALSFITFLDRAAIGQAAPFMRRDLGLSAVEMGYAFSAFGLAYALLEIPAGMYCDLKGPRKVLTRIVVWWSLFTIATGWSWSFASLWITRFLFGAGEAGCYPGLARLFRTWLPLPERAVAEGLKAASARFGAAVAPTLVVVLYRFLSWRSVFLVFGFTGFIWAAAFYWWFRDRPSEHPSVNAQELALIPAEQDRGYEAAPWRAYWGSVSLRMLCLQWFCHFYGFYFYITWLPTYLQEARGVTVARSAVLAGFPLLTAALGSMAGGWAVSGLARYFDTGQARKIVCYASYLGAAILMIPAIRVSSVEIAIALMSLSSFAVELSGPISWTTAMDLGGRHVGAVSGAMNSIGQLGGAIAPAAVGLFVGYGGNDGWSVALYSAAAAYAVGFLCWLFLDPVTPLRSEASLI